MRRKAASDNYRTASIPSTAKLRAFRCQDFSNMSREERLDYANAIHAAVTADNKRQGQSYKPRWKSESQCQYEYDQHMKEQRNRPPEPVKIVQFKPERKAEPKPAKRKSRNRQADIERAVSRFAADLDMIAADIHSNQLAA